MSGAIDRLRRALTWRWFPWLLAIVAGLVHLPGLKGGYLVDDYVHRYFAQGYRMPGGARGPWDLYRFADGGESAHQAMDAAFHQWWTDPQLKLAFFRPITSLLRVAEEAVFHEHAVFCHVVSILIFVATTLAVWRLFNLWIGGAAASLGALLFAIDDSHSTPVAWIAARHTLLGTLFVVLALTAFLKSREQGRVSWASGALFFAGLASSESAVSGLAFFGALVLFDRQRAILARARQLAPAAAATVVWLACYKLLGCGARGSGYYVDPLSTPLAFLRVAASRGPTLALAQLAGIPAELSGVAPAAAPALALAGTLVFAGFAWLSLRVLPERRRVATLLVAFALALVPACGTNSDDRLLVLPGVAVFGLLAYWARYVANAQPSLKLRLAVGVGVFIHVAMALLLLPLRTISFDAMLSGIVGRGADSLPGDVGVASVELVALSAPDGLLPSSMLLSKKLAGRPVPQRLRILSTSPGSVLTVKRVAPSVLELSSDGGMMRDPFLLAVRSDLFQEGDRVEVRGLEVQVVEVRDGYPTKLRFSFADGSLDDGTRRFLGWREHGFVPIELPAVGSSVELPAIDYAEEMAYQP